MSPEPTSILIVDDDRASLLLIEYLFKSAGLGEQVKTALGSEMGLRLLEELKSSSEVGPALIILDVEMPRIDGFGLLDWINNNFSDTRPTTIMMSASQAPHHLRRASDLNADAYFMKFPSADALKEIYGLACKIREGDKAAREALRTSPGSVAVPAAPPRLN